MSLRDFIAKQWIDVIEWVEPEEGILAYRYPCRIREIQNGGKLTVSRLAVLQFLWNEGKVADSFRPGLYTLNTETLPILNLSQELGQSVQVAIQVRRLFLFRANSNRPALGHAEPHLHSRQGIRRNPSFEASAFTPTT